MEVPAADLPLQTAARTGRRWRTVQLDVVIGQGVERSLLAMAHPLLDPSGATRGAVAAFVDVTDMVRVARELLAALDENRTLLASSRRNALLYREMARNFPNGAISLFDHDLRFLIFDGTQFAIRRNAKTNVGRTLAEIFPPTSRPSWSRSTARRSPGGRDGSTSWSPGAIWRSGPPRSATTPAW